MNTCYSPKTVQLWHPLTGVRHAPTDLRSRAECIIIFLSLSPRLSSAWLQGRLLSYRFSSLALTDED